MDDLFLDDAVAHTRAKHRILEEYLKAWVPILARGQTNRLLYFDGFAGCGELVGNHPGSPIVAIRTALQAHPNDRVKFEVQMVEKEAPRCEHLKEIVRSEQSALRSLTSQIEIHEPICEECETAVLALLHEHRKSKKQLGPAFFFLDQYGYSGFSMDLVRQILANSMCETFAYLNWQRLNPYLTDGTKAATITKAMGGDEWKAIQGLNRHARAEGFKTIYMSALRTRAGAKYVYDFAMRDKNNQLIYWLFFCTNERRGLEVMKKAMWKVDPTGRFEFSDQDVGQGRLLEYTQSLLADDLYGALVGQKLTSDALKEFVLTKTPEFRFAEAISILKKRGCVEERRKKPGETLYCFKRPPMTTGSLFGD